MNGEVLQRLAEHRLHPPSTLHKLPPLPADRLNDVTCSISCFRLIKCSAIRRITSFSFLLFPLLSRCSAGRHYRPSAVFASCQSFFFSSFLPSCFLPSTNFKYSHRVLSTIAYKHSEIIESQRAGKKKKKGRRSDRVQSM